MQWHTHVQFGLNTLWLWQLAAFPLNSQQLVLIVGFCALGALLPDLDASESKIKHFSVSGIKPFMLSAQAFHQQWGHRGFTHSLLGLATTIPLALLLTPYAGWQSSLALLLGYGSHLAADACTKTGIPLLYPRHGRYHLLPARLRFVTGSQAEEALFALLSVSVVLFLLLHLSPTA